MPSVLQQQGTWAEEYAAQYLVRLGWSIVARQYHTRYGEIDIVAKDPQGMWVFVEVKARRSLTYGAPEEAVTAFKIRKIARALYAYLHKHHIEHELFRIDVIALEMMKAKPVVLRHYPSVG